MLTTQRKQLILDVLAREGQVIAKALSAEFGLSEDTIRRDLRDLAAEGLLQRVHGGAVPASPTVARLAVRRGMSTEAKAELGRHAAAMIEPGQTVIFDGGTSNREIIRHLPPALPFTAVTHSPTIAAAFEELPAVEVVLIGGKLYRHSMVVVGALALESIMRIRADLFFLGVTGVHATKGLTTGDAEEAAIKRALMSRAAETIVLATADKLGAVSAAQISSVAEIDRLLVERPASEQAIAAVAALREAGCQLVEL